eukprot:GDKJ01001510.1.p1 GENE.GDKJ01001510.1~~GDKJ01001510.1.p1  ORF type:complete len:947 (+),score=335.75 GDKJ01001510.1:1581-4421(+)
MAGNASASVRGESAGLALLMTKEPPPVEEESAATPLSSPNSRMDFSQGNRSSNNNPFFLNKNQTVSNDEENQSTRSKTAPNVFPLDVISLNLINENMNNNSDNQNSINPTMKSQSQQQMQSTSLSPSSPSPSPHLKPLQQQATLQSQSPDRVQQLQQPQSNIQNQISNNLDVSAPVVNNSASNKTLNKANVSVMPSPNLQHIKQHHNHNTDEVDVLVISPGHRSSSVALGTLASQQNVNNMLVNQTANPSLTTPFAHRASSVSSMLSPHASPSPRVSFTGASPLVSPQQHPMMQQQQQQLSDSDALLPLSLTSIAMSNAASQSNPKIAATAASSSNQRTVPFSGATPFQARNTIAASPQHLLHVHPSSNSANNNSNNMTVLAAANDFAMKRRNSLPTATSLPVLPLGAALNSRHQTPLQAKVPILPSTPNSGSCSSVSASPSAAVLLMPSCASPSPFLLNNSHPLLANAALSNSSPNLVGYQSAQHQTHFVSAPQGRTTNLILGKVSSSGSSIAGGASSTSLIGGMGSGYLPHHNINAVVHNNSAHLNASSSSSSSSSSSQILNNNASNAPLTIPFLPRISSIGSSLSASNTNNSQVTNLPFMGAGGLMMIGGGIPPGLGYDFYEDVRMVLPPASPSAAFILNSTYNNNNTNPRLVASAANHILSGSNALLAESVCSVIDNQSFTNNAAGIISTTSPIPSPPMSQKIPARHVRSQSDGSVSVLSHKPQHSSVSNQPPHPSNTPPAFASGVATLNTSQQNNNHHSSTSSSQHPVPSAHFVNANTAAATAMFGPNLHSAESQQHQRLDSVASVVHHSPSSGPIALSNCNTPPSNDYHQYSQLGQSIKPQFFRQASSGSAFSSANDQAANTEGAFAQILAHSTGNAAMSAKNTGLDQKTFTGPPPLSEKKSEGRAVNSRVSPTPLNPSPSSSSSSSSDHQQRSSSPRLL